MASEAKRRRTETEVKKDLLNALMKVCMYLDESHVTLTPLRIKGCNGASPCGPSFTEAFCDTEPYEPRLLFGDVFQNGIAILRDRELPKDKHTLFLFNKLMDVLKGDRSLNLSDPTKLRSLSGNELTVLVTNHLLRKLAPSPCYLIDRNNSERKDDCCLCGEDSCKLTGSYGDTSVGHPEVWHGNLNVIINDELTVEPLDGQPGTPETSGGESPAQMKLRSTLMETPPIIPQTIVFSFLQKKRHPDRNHYLTPCIGIGRSELVIMLYDSEHDVLMESSTIPLFENDVSCDFSYCAVLVCWLTVNYRYFCSGVNEKDKIFKSNFFDIANEKIVVYEENLQYQNVNSNCLPELKLRHPPVNVKPYVSPFMHETQKMLFAKYLQLNKPDKGCSDERN